MVVIVAQALFFLLPAYVANMCPVIFGNVSWLQGLKKPIDRGRKLGSGPPRLGMARRLGSGRLFGQHKTYLGFVVGVPGAFIVSLLQILMYVQIPSLRWLYLFEYSIPLAAVLGFFMGFGALFGDLFKSFIKRRLGFKDGVSFFPFDQLDFVFGGLLFGALVYVPSWIHILVLLLLTPLLHFLSNLAGYKLGLKKVWW